MSDKVLQSDTIKQWKDKHNTLSERVDSINSNISDLQSKTDSLEEDIQTTNDNLTSNVDAILSSTVSNSGGNITGNLSVTGNIEAASIVTDSQLAFRNKIINGNFDIWQRGTSSASSATSRYLADRWHNIAITHSLAVSRQAFSLGQTDVPNEPTYFHRAICTLGGTVSGAAALLRHSIESVRTLAGKTAVVSFYAKADAAKPMSVEVHQNFGSSWGEPTTGVTCGVQKVNLTTSWQKFEVVVSVPSISGKTLGTDGNDALQINFWFAAGSTYNTRTDTLGHQAGTFDIARVQLEEGSVATPFEQRPIGLELSLCQRYYQRLTGNSAGGGFLTGTVVNATDAYCWIPFSPMRTAPTVATSGTINFTSVAGAWVLNTASVAHTTFLQLRFTGTGGTAWQAGYGSLSTVGAYIALDAEL